MAENDSFIDKSNLLSKSSLGAEISGESLIHSLPMNTLPAKRKKSMRNIIIKEAHDTFNFSSEKPERKRGKATHNRCETCPNLEINIIDRTPPRPLVFNNQIADKRSSVTKISLSKFLKKSERKPFK